jgi:hypothetical protein
MRSVHQSSFISADRGHEWDTAIGVVLQLHAATGERIFWELLRHDRP